MGYVNNAINPGWFDTHEEFMEFLDDVQRLTCEKYGVFPGDERCPKKDRPNGCQCEKAK